MAKFPARLPRSREPSQPALSYEHIENFTKDLEVMRDLGNRASPVNRAHMKRPLVVTFESVDKILWCDSFPVEMAPLLRRIYSILLVCFMILQNEISDFLSVWMLTKLKAEVTQVFEAHFQHVFHLHSS